MLRHSFNLQVVRVNIAEVLKDDSDHYDHVIKAARSLLKRQFTYRNRAGDVVNTLWVLRVTHIARSGVLVLLMDGSFYDCLFDFRKGFVAYDLQKAMSLRHPQSVRLYQMVNTMQPQGVTFTLPYLKEAFGVSDKYARNNDFIRKVIEVAHDELKAQPEGNYFEFKVIKGRGGKIESIHIWPVKRAKSLEQQAAPSSVAKWLPAQYIAILCQHAGFTLRQIAANKPTIEKLQEHPLGMPLLLDIIQRCRKTRPANPQGYIINALRYEMGLKPSLRKQTKP